MGRKKFQSLEEVAHVFFGDVVEKSGLARAISHLGGNDILLYGQGDYAARMESYLGELFPQVSLKKVILPLDTDQPDRTAFDFQLVEEKLTAYDKSMPVVAAFSAKYRDEVLAQLDSIGFAKVIYYDSKLDNLLKTEFFRQYFRKMGKTFLLLKEMLPEHDVLPRSLAIYMAVCASDKPLSEPPKPSRFVMPIQVGAALTDKRIAAVTDNEGDNISDRNRRYSEMTAFYWMWKHAKADYLGLCHYRRLFVNPEGIADKLQRVDIDALLPLPTLCEHSVHEDYLLKHIPDVWELLLEVIWEQSPEYSEDVQKVFGGRVFYASNMCILRREVLDDLCSWMFPIVMEVERRVGELSNRYYNRYAGFCTERLITLYFICNKRHWRIAHVEKVFLR